MENKSIIIITITIIAVCIIACAASYYVITQQNNMKTLDFEVFTMSVPSDANLVFNSTYSESGFSGWNDEPNGHYSVYYENLSSFSGKNVAYGSHIKVISGVEELTSDKLNVPGNCTIYRHVKNGKDEFWAYYEIDKYSITLKADSMNHLVEMLNSIKIKN